MPLTLTLVARGRGAPEVSALGVGIVDRLAFRRNANRPPASSATSGLNLAYTYDGFLTTGETLSGAVSGSVAYGYDSVLRVNGLTVNARQWGRLRRPHRHGERLN